MGDAYNPQIPAYNEDAAKNAMDESERVSMNVRTYSRDDEEWEMKIKKFGWTKAQLTLFNDVTRILDLDHLARLAHKERQHEPVLRRVVIDKSAARMRKSLAKIAWEQRSTQWLHGLLMDNLPPSYMASYLDILQTLKSKVPSLVDKMMFGRPISGNQDILGTVLKRAWEPLVVHKVHMMIKYLIWSVVTTTFFFILESQITQSTSYCHNSIIGNNGFTNIALQSMAFIIINNGTCKHSSS